MGNEKDKGKDACLHITELPVGDLIIVKNNINWKYSPKEDITPLEVALMFPMFMSYHTTGYLTQYDYLGYIIENNLERHFCKDTNNENNM